jgi:maleamate amidohydrolase
VPRPWDDLLGAQDRATIERAGFGGHVGVGPRPAVLVIDVQNYMLGPPPGSLHDYPVACTAMGPPAVAQTARLLSVARSADVPVFYTRFELARDGSDAGVYARKRGLLSTEGWCLEGSEGAQIASILSPEPGDVVVVKKKPSAFHGTPLLGYLLDRAIDTVVITGGSTSNCVRATAVDAASYNLRTIIAEDCVFDRFEVSHRVALFDLDRQYGDVVPADELIAAWSRRHDARGRRQGQ